MAQTLSSGGRIGSAGLSQAAGKQAGLSWFGIIRLGAVQASIGAIVMLASSLLNRVMVVEYSVAAAIPAALVAWHYAVQLTRPLWGHHSDRSARRTPWIIGGMSLLVIGALMAVNATIMMASPSIFGALLAISAFTLIGFGVGIAGTTLLALLASRVSMERKPASAAITWIMMIAGIVIAAAVAGANLDPFSPQRLAIVCSFVALAAFSLMLLALYRLEETTEVVERPHSDEQAKSFPEVLREIWQEDQARRFTYFVFLSMLAYSMQDLIMEPFAGFLFAMTPGESTTLSSIQHGGILIGMLVAGLGGSLFAHYYGSNLKIWIVLGCAGSAMMLAGLSMAASTGGAWPLTANVFGLGFANGMFAVGAVSAMLGLASKGVASGEGARMGVWGAAQAIAFGLGGLLGAVIVDQLRSMTGEDVTAFQIVFAVEALLFIGAALMATTMQMPRKERQTGAVKEAVGA
ncbi:BCD family MFS transporter [Alterisphingorhabdus coralli]|uniref:BCD family MFS transporter n=1 Tax=Alterisphingorhabdus coralli TaxID=3071408 RepID=A0AA97F8P4_9SPHN|nr:BCD family MFS transporter [Parasphingorhabdus sp. SCSIO 66989]WOE74530.1 BCD family MFS transporter [Parasphingorhabdus sp. SCSIO 66989]